MTANDDNGRRWIRRFGPPHDPAARVVCFPHAGGSASFFYPLTKHLPSDVEVLAVQYPGRQDRRAEQALTDLGAMTRQVVEALADFTDRPLILFGHSMGATVAYEVARTLATHALFVSARPAPHRVKDDGLHRLTDQEIVKDVLALDSSGTEIFDDPDLLGAVVSAIRSDYTAAETYRHVPGPVLACPVHALAGFADPRLPVGDMHHWAVHTDGTFDLRVFPGGHFYLTSAWSDVAAIVAAVTAR